MIQLKEIVEERVKGLDGKFIVTVCGSFRRGGCDVEYSCTFNKNMENLEESPNSINNEETSSESHYFG